MGYKILVVDDEEPIRDLLTGFLEGQGHTVVLASNGKEALLLAEKESPHLIVLDVRMPELDGIETCVALRERMSRPERSQLSWQPPSATFSRRRWRQELTTS